METSRKIMLMLFVVFLSGTFSRAFAASVKVDADLAKLVMLADKKGTNYLKIAVKGLAVPDICCKRAPVNIAIVIDKSGSMSGEKIENAKQAAINAICHLNTSDIVSVVTYDSCVNVVVPATQVTDKDYIIRRIQQINADSRTALYDGVCTGAKELRKFIEENMVNRLILLSDGLANIGPSSPQELGRLGDKLSKERISVTTIGIGLGYNEDLMTQLAYKSDGSHYFVEKSCGLTKIFDIIFGNVISTVAQEIQIEINCAAGVRPVKLLGRQGTIKGQKVTACISQLNTQNQKFILLEVEVPAGEDCQSQRIADVKVTYDDLSSHTPKTTCKTIDVRFSDSAHQVESSTNRSVMADVVELTATQRNELALELRDKGRAEDARRILTENESYLRGGAVMYDSKKLADYAKSQREDCDNMDEANWSRQRKLMRAGQAANNLQQ